MAVVQGNTDRELTQCMFDYVEMSIPNVCIPFHIEFFKNMGSTICEDIRDHYRHVYYDLAEVNVNEDLEYSMGRVQWVKNHSAMLSVFKYIHFLGSHCPLEKYFFEKLDNKYVSMDTGYPVKLAVEGIRLYEETHKPNTIIDDFLEKDLSEEVRNIIKENINIFKNT